MRHFALCRILLELGIRCPQYSTYEMIVRLSSNKIRTTQRCNTVVDRTALHHDGYTGVDEAVVAAVDVDFT